MIKYSSFSPFGCIENNLNSRLRTGGDQTGCRLRGSRALCVWPERMDTFVEYKRLLCSTHALPFRVPLLEQTRKCSISPCKSTKPHSFKDEMNNRPLDIYLYYILLPRKWSLCLWMWIQNIVSNDLVCPPTIHTAGLYMGVLGFFLCKDKLFNSTRDTDLL